ncbi:hypothetical protein OUZ56_004333 [Daphnia magna]|uniref:Uncharacterized protein n=1 Tax=Daphnia magna TaxID=35525 RepID=A0ABQ9YPF8_9CRUS|nr:hypothetical protein OUZ56_004333 [Daphnia magna]
MNMWRYPVGMRIPGRYLGVDVETVTMPSRVDCRWSVEANKRWTSLRLAERDWNNCETSRKEDENRGNNFEHNCTYESTWAAVMAAAEAAARPTTTATTPAASSSDVQQPGS